jgi:primosomal protein N' (replication factor Y)
VEEFFKAEFPGVRYARLDTDVTRKKGVMEDTLRAMRERKLDVLIGTQMISKGLDFSGVTLTVILMPDGLVKMSDYSSGEKAFQLFVQIAGRAGRAEKEGRVFLQTYLPDNDVYHYFKNYALEDFYSHELKIRRELMFPPRASLIQFLSSSEDQEKARENALKCYEALLEFPPELYLELYPPQKSPIEKIENRFRWRIVMKASYSDMLWDSLYRLRKEYKPLYNSRLKIRVDPENLL